MASSALHALPVPLPIAMHHHQHQHQHHQQQQHNQVFMCSRACCTTPSTTTTTSAATAAAVAAAAAPYPQNLSRDRTPLSTPVMPNAKDWNRPLLVDCSVEYDLPYLPTPPVHSEPLLMIHPAYFRQKDNNKAHSFVNNLPYARSHHAMNGRSASAAMTAAAVAAAPTAAVGATGFVSSRQLQQQHCTSSTDSGISLGGLASPSRLQRDFPHQTDSGIGTPVDDGTNEIMWPSEEMGSSSARLYARSSARSTTRCSCCPVDGTGNEQHWQSHMVASRMNPRVGRGGGGGGGGGGGLPPQSDFLPPLPLNNVTRGGAPANIRVMHTVEPNFQQQKTTTAWGWAPLSENNNAVSDVQVWPIPRVRERTHLNAAAVAAAAAAANVRAQTTNHLLWTNERSFGVFHA